MNATTDLFYDYRGRVNHWARQMVDQDADDIVQEAFLKAHQYVANGNAIRSPASFFYVTVRNLVIDRFHRSPFEFVDTDVAEIAADAQSVERIAMSDREFEALVVAVRQLPPRMQEVFVLRKIYGYTNKEIAAHLGSSVETVKKQAWQAFKRLQSSNLGTY